ncbi:MAG: TonB-dependent copper receptor [Chitinivorax sp.]
MSRSILTLAIAAAFPSLGLADPVELEPAVVTATRIAAPLTTVTQAKTPRQPVPANDGADYLKTIPGFNVIRKGGADGDPVLRGMAGSRLNILLDGEQILGGCGNRMDPPTAYVFPESYDRISVIKGPQTVAHGAGNSAGTVLFEYDRQQQQQPGGKLYGSLMAGSFSRLDELLEARGSSAAVDGRVVASHSHSDDYRDGSGNIIHSNYTRWNSSAALGLHMGEQTRLEISAAKSDGEAAYADRSVDGSKFARDNVGLKLDTHRPLPGVEKIEAQLYRNYVDHVMDNYSLRDFVPAGMSTEPASMNPDRLTRGGRLALTLSPGEANQLQLGIDGQQNNHSGRMSMKQWSQPVENMARVDDAFFRQLGLFAELTHYSGETERLIGGARLDQWRADDLRSTVSVGMGSMANPTANASRSNALHSGFIRFERDLPGGLTTYAGVGHVQRFPDYWELFNKESATTLSAFAVTRPEKTSQLDIGISGSQGAIRLGLSAFANRIDNFILIQSGYSKPAAMGTSRSATITRNIDASSWGLEASAGRNLGANLKLDATLAYVHGDNTSDHLPLAQLPPLESRLIATWDNRVWSFGGLVRLVARQERIAPNQGNIVGQDIDATGGFGVLSLNAGWKPDKMLQLSAGVDNLLDKNYAEHISRGAVAIPGYALQTTRVNEPGRNLWLKLNAMFD